LALKFTEVYDYQIIVFLISGFYKCLIYCLQCFDAVGCVSGRASKWWVAGLPRLSWKRGH